VLPTSQEAEAKRPAKATDAQLLFEFTDARPAGCFAQAGQPGDRVSAKHIRSWQHRRHHLVQQQAQQSGKEFERRVRGQGGRRG